MITASPIAEETVRAEWESALVGAAKLKERGAKRLFNSTPNIEQAFVLKGRSLVCVDEGIAYGIHLPGSGVLMSTDQRRAEIKNAGIEEFTTHENCGAFRMAFPNETNPNQACQEWGRREADALGLPYRHINVGELDRPPELHTALVAYYDGTGVFNRIPGLPRGFVISRKHFSTAKEDLELRLMNIFRNFGFGKLFTRENPLYLIALAHPTDPSLSAKILEAEARHAAAGYGAPVRVEAIRTNWLMRSQV